MKTQTLRIAANMFYLTDGTNSRKANLGEEDEVEAEVGEGLGVLVHEVDELLGRELVVMIRIDQLENFRDDLEKET